MYIILMRHGDAEPETESVANRDRRLTPKGMRRVRKSARILSGFLKGKPADVFASPFERTRQTAEIVSAECAINAWHTAPELAQPSWSLVASHLLREGRVTLLISHQPFLQRWIMHAGAVIKFDTAAMAVLDYDRPSGRCNLVAYFTPQIKELGKD